MAKYTLTIAGKDDKIYSEGFTISNTKPRYRIGSKETADKFNKGGAQIVPVKSKAKEIRLATQEECDRANLGGVQVVVHSSNKILK